MSEKMEDVKACPVRAGELCYSGDPLKPLKMHLPASADPALTAALKRAADAEAERDDWRRESDRLRAVANELDMKVEHLAPMANTLHSLDRIFGCDHTSLGADDLHNLVRHVRELKDERDQYKKWLVIGDCKQCAGTGYFADSTEGGITVMCNCQAARFDELRKERDSWKESGERHYSDAQSLAMQREKLGTELNAAKGIIVKLSHEKGDAEAALAACVGAMSLAMAQCECSAKDRESGHRTGCYVPTLESLLYSLPDRAAKIQAVLTAVEKLSSYLDTFRSAMKTHNLPIQPDWEALFIAKDALKAVGNG